MATKYAFCHYTFGDVSRATNVVQNYFCQEIFLHLKFRLLVTNFFITECLFSYSGYRYVFGLEVICLYYKTRGNSNFLRKCKLVISVKIRNFSRSRMTKRTSPLESSREI